MYQIHSCYSHLCPCVDPWGAYFPIHPSSRQCIITLPSPLYLKIVQERHHDHCDGKHNQVGKAGLYTGHQAIAEDYAPAYGMDTRSALLAMTKTIMNIDMNMIIHVT